MAGFVQSGLICGSVVALLAALAVGSPAEPITFGVDLTPSKGAAFRHFWESCGWCPPDPHPLFPAYYDTEQVAQNHAIIASLPRRGIKFVRIHFLLDLIGLESASADGATHVDAGLSNPHPSKPSQTPSTRYNHVPPLVRMDTLPPSMHGAEATREFWQGTALNFTALDAAMTQLVSLGLAPGFEIMGNPGNDENRTDRLFTDFSEAAQVTAFSQLISVIAKRYIAMFGVETVRQWRWESWNEPDGECGADLKVGIKCNPDSFLSYFDACSNGLRSVDSQLVFGGPASDGANAFLADLITHCLTGKDRITGEQACTGNGRVDYLNAHKKGDESTAAVVDIELPVALHVKQVTEGSHLAGAAWGNDECDPKVGWSKEYPWRGDSRYAAMVPREVQQHLEVFIQENHIKYDILGNDNGFLNYGDNTNKTFDQRTLTSLWMYNNTHSVELLRKPVLNSMALLGLTGDVLYNATGGAGPAMTAEVGAIATSFSESGAVSILLWRSNDSAPIDLTVPEVTARLELTGLPWGATDTVRMATYTLDETHGNSHTTWVAAGSPRFPTQELLHQMRVAAEIPTTQSGVAAVTGGAVNLEVNLTLPSVNLVRLCPESVPSPPMVTNLTVRKSTSQVFASQYLVSWGGVENAECLRTYIVARNGFRVNTGVDTVFTRWSHDLLTADASDAPRSSCYTVAAVDIFDRVGPKSAEVCV